MPSVRYKVQRAATLTVAGQVTCALRALLQLQLQPPSLPPSLSPFLDVCTAYLCSGWTRITHCTGGTGIEASASPSSTDRLDYPAAVIQSIATSAASVRICTGADCVMSLPGTFPIEMLRLGRAVSHNGDAACDQTCVAQVWSGSAARLAQLWSSCGPPEAPYPMGYHSCGNAAGLHMGTLDLTYCRWGVGNTNGEFLEVYIDTTGTAGPPSKHNKGSRFVGQRC